MSALTMLDRALILAQHELEALNAGDVEAAEDHFMKRSELLTAAYKKHDEENKEDYVFKLVAIQGYNQIIYEAGEKLRDSIKNSLKSVKKSNKVAKSYMQVARQY